MAGSVRERLAALASPLGIQLPEEYVAFVESPPARGILIRHLRAEGDDPDEWWPETIDGLEAGWGSDGPGGTPLPFAHYVRATADSYAGGPTVALRMPGGKKFRVDRLRDGFWIGEVDGDSVFLDRETLGVFAYLEHESRVEKWAASFGEFVALGQQKYG